jgi:hypothetical protein
MQTDPSFEALRFEYWIEHGRRTMRPSRPVIAGAILAAVGTAAAEEPPREIGLFGGDVALLSCPARPEGPTILPPPREPARRAPSVMTGIPERIAMSSDPVGAKATDAAIRRWIAALAGPDAGASADARARLADAPPKALLYNAKRALRDAAPGIRLAGVEALRLHGQPDAVPPLASRVLYESGPAVRRAMAEALGALPDPGGRGEAVLRRRLMAGDRATRIRTAEVMGATRKRAFVEVLVTTYKKITGRSNRAHIFVGTQGRYIDDFDVEVTAQAFALDPHIGTVQYGAVLETMVIKIEEEWREIERRVIHDALVSVTGVDLGTHPAAWERWVRAERARKTGVDVRIVTVGGGGS